MPRLGPADPALSLPPPQGSSVRSDGPSTSERTGFLGMGEKSQFRVRSATPPELWLPKHTPFRGAVGEAPASALGVLGPVERARSRDGA